MKTLNVLFNIQRSRGSSDVSAPDARYYQEDRQSWVPTRRDLPQEPDPLNSTDYILFFFPSDASCRPTQLVDTSTYTFTASH